MQESNARRVTRKIAVSMTAQIISLAVSFLLNLIVPKFISEYQYAYWQTFLLYVNYVGVLHFGLLDGIVLRYSQYNYDQLDKPLLRSQFHALFLSNCLFASVSVAIALILNVDITSEIVALVGLGIITKNVFTYTSYTFQITNRIGNYAILVIAQRLIYGVAAGVLILLGVDNFVWYCLADLLGDIAGIAIGLICNKGLYVGKGVSIQTAVWEINRNLSSGIKLMVATWSSIMLVGLAKMMIQWRWNELVFGKVSFAFSVSNLFLTFVAAISIVLFPSIKRMDPTELPKLYTSIRRASSPILFGMLLFYFPGCWILERWLPTYVSSLKYLGILLPMIVFSSQVSLLTDNYLKAYRKEKTMLFVNLASIAFATVFFVLSAYVFESVELLLASVVVAIMLRSIVSEWFVSKVINIRLYNAFVKDLLMVAAFWVFVNYLSLWKACVYYAFSYLFYVLCNPNLLAKLSPRKNKS